MQSESFNQGVCQIDNPLEINSRKYFKNRESGWSVATIRVQHISYIAILSKWQYQAPLETNAMYTTAQSIISHRSIDPSIHRSIEAAITTARISTNTPSSQLALHPYIYFRLYICDCPFSHTFLPPLDSPDNSRNVPFRRPSVLGNSSAPLRPIPAPCLQ